MARVVILGAGLTGLSTAYHLEKHNFFDFKIFEKDRTHGGLCRSVKHNGFTFDFTGHLLHCNNSYFQSILDILLPEKTRNTIARNSFIYTHERFIPYPIQMNLFGLPSEVITECLSGFLKRKHQIKDPKTFREWVLKHFGTGFAKNFFFPYNSKILCTKPEQIHPSWTGRFVPKTSINDLISGLEGQKKPNHVGYNHHFYYPKHGGIQFFTDNLQKQVKSKINTSHNAISIDIVRKKVIFSNGHQEPYEILITTAPLKDFLQIIEEPSSRNLRKNHTKLLCNSVINFNLGFANPTGFTNPSEKNKNKKHWIYIPEKKYSFYRAGFWHNFSESLCPRGRSSMYGELAYLPEKAEEAKLEMLTQKSIKQASTIFNIAQKDIVTQKILHIRHAYVIYDAWRSQNLSKIHESLNDYSIYSIGRYGGWRYSSMQEAILDGQTMAQEIMEKDQFWSKITENRSDEKFL
jgi:protoporphyrinogen oxidase